MRLVRKWAPTIHRCFAPRSAFNLGRRLALNFHIGASDIALSFFATAPWPSLDQERQFLVGGMDLAMSNARVLSNLIVGGVTERFPELKFVSVESGIGWLPFFLELLDYQMSRRRRACSA